tara:strand:+ start:5521 stop:6180 length:660 start_codon:yes stop_codon:yes gene_type:complete
MNKDDLESVIDRYNKRLDEFGYSPKSLGWGSGKQNLRFSVLLSQWEINGEHILDFGCGFGDLYGYCENIGLEIKYEGIDINQNLVNEGRRRYPNAHIRCSNLLKEKNPPIYDYIFSSGTHNIPISNNWEFIKQTFDAFNTSSKKGFALNFVSNKVDFKDKNLFYTDPLRALELAYKYSNRVVIRNDYMPFEFSIFIYKSNHYDPKLLVYKEFEELAKES